MKKVLETFYVVNVNCEGNEDICEAIITINFPCNKS